MDLVVHDELLVLFAGDGLRVHHPVVLQKDLEEVLEEAAHHGHPRLGRRHQRRLRVTQVPEDDPGHHVAVASVPELFADHLVVSLPHGTDSRRL